MSKFEADQEYMFTLRESVKLDGIRFSRTETHFAKGLLLAAMVEQEGEKVIDTAVPR
ncbi:hypothetical protein [Devosia sp. 1635]|uniref:hypothetical protein n=1 Tax=Devosia sp. 1635 TaxID=2726066 RepID=UPI0015652732|nr:hypothetical protein [Devosia sp. 1635]